MNETPSLQVTLPDHSEPIELPCDADATLAEHLERAGYALNTRCGGEGLCNGCLVELHEGQLRDTAGEIVSAQEEPALIRACRHCPTGRDALRITVPRRSLLAAEPQITTDFALKVPHARQPIIACDQSPPPLGIAIDIGTTTVVVLLTELATDRRLAEAADFNKQTRLGDNVLTRINHCIQDESMTERLQQALVKLTLRPLIKDCLKQAKVEADRIGVVIASGNTTMLHLLAGVNPAPLGVAPFEPVFTDHRVMEASELGLEELNCPVHLLPSAAGYVGADLVGGVITSGLRYEPGPSLLVDIGTNGEIILKHDHHLLGCATAAGPAFEGGGLSCGMRAADGAISRIIMHTDPFRIETQTIGERPPIGLCGTAYIDLLSEGRRCGLINRAGRFDPDFPGAPLEKCDYGLALTLASPEHGKAITVHEGDIAGLLQAKAAIAAGVMTLLGRLDLTPADVQAVHLAGGFGMNLHLPSALGCGLLPGFTLEQVDLVGNTSLAGAALVGWDQTALEEMRAIRQEMDVIELNLDPNFEMQFIEQLTLQ